MSNFDIYKDDLEKLIKLGNTMLSSLLFRNADATKLSEEKRELFQTIKNSFDKNYQDWYSESYSVIRQLLPERLEEFSALYKSDSRRKKIDIMTFSIQDWVMDVRAEVNIYTGEKPFDDLAAATMRFTTQLNILKSVKKRFESKLFEIGPPAKVRY